MRHTEGRDGLQLLHSSPGLPEFEGRSPGDMSVDDCQSESGEELNDSDIAELGDEALSLLGDVALAPPRGDGASCSCGCESDNSCVEFRHMEMSLLFHFLMAKAEDLHMCIFNEEDRPKKEELVAAIKILIHTCQPLFNHLESTAWGSAMSQHSPPLLDIVKLQDFSQQLCDKLEQLVLTYAEHSLLCLDESDPDGMSHFCMGQTQLGPLRLTVFRYCRPAPYLSRVDTGLYKRMRWNVEMLQDEQQGKEEEQGEESEGMTEPLADTEFYFLCYEDIPNRHADAAGQSPDQVVRLWSIGQWVQVNPDPETDDIFDWIMSEVPQADYHRLLFLGSKEPSCCRATECLQQLLLSK